MGKRILTENDIDQSYDPTSSNAQSGTSVADAISNKLAIHKGTDISTNITTILDIVHETGKLVNGVLVTEEWIERLPYKVGDLYLNTDESVFYRCTQINDEDEMYSYTFTPVVDLKYSPDSENSQSGKAVAEAIAETVGNINTVLATLVEVE